MTGKTKLLRANLETERSIAFGALTDVFQVMGAAFTHPIRELRLYNQTDVVIQYSLDGTNIHASLAAGEAWNINAMSLKQSDIGCYFRDGLAVYAKHITGAAPSSGSARINTVFAE